MSPDSKQIIKIVIDLAVIAILGVTLLVLLLWAEPYERGFFEDDLSIRLPYKAQTISEGLLAGLGFVIIVITIFIVELLRDQQGKSGGERFLRGNLVPGWVWEVYRGVGVFTFGAACQQLTSNLAKFVIGRLRPHFYAVCSPSWDAGAELNQLGYIQNFTCAQTNASLLKDMRLSFPSAHSSFAMYTAVFFVFYIQNKAKWRGSKLLRHGIQYAMFLAAWYVGLSRVQDHMHHWSDVAVGFAIGATYAALAYIYVLKPKKYGIPGSWHEAAPAPENILPRPVLAR